MAVVTNNDVFWVVVDATGEVMLICSGADAAEVANEWIERGCQVICLGADEVRAA
ncbi:MAG TPA: hypothetical protein VKW77_09310 [Acidimicrobiales bacterium]|nr:hypothetical protein [Acidimicrobiales bacterium]